MSSFTRPAGVASRPGMTVCRFAGVAMSSSRDWSFTNAALGPIVCCRGDLERAAEVLAATDAAHLQGREVESVRKMLEQRLG
jgi:hypothetical protein